MFIATNSTELILTLCGIGLTVASCYYQPAHTAPLERQLDFLRNTSRELHHELASAQQELRYLQEISKCGGKELIFPFGMTAQREGI
jgi:hypothetical protein